MIRATSKAAYTELRDSGNMGTKKRKIYDYVSSHPGCTRIEISRAHNDLPINTVCGRVREMIIESRLLEDGCKRDSITGQSSNRLYVNEDMRATA